MFSECRPDIIGYTTMSSMATGEIGGVTVTGTISPGIEIMPRIIGGGESSLDRCIVAKINGESDPGIEGLATKVEGSQ